MPCAGGYAHYCYAGAGEKVPNCEGYIIMFTQRIIMQMFRMYTLFETEGNMV